MVILFSLGTVYNTIKYAKVLYSLNYIISMLHYLVQFTHTKMAATKLQDFAKEQ